MPRTANGAEPRYGRKVAAHNHLHYGPAGRGIQPFRKRNEPRARRVASRKRRVDDDVAGDLQGALVGVALALDAGVPLESAADIVFRIDDGPVVVDPHALELREVDAAAGRLGVLHLGEVGADLGGVELVFPRDRNQGIGGKQLGARTAGTRRRRRRCRRPRRRRACRRRGRDGFAARRDLPWETTATRGRECRSADNRPGWGRERRGLSGRPRHSSCRAACGGRPSGWESPDGRCSSRRRA